MFYNINIEAVKQTRCLQRAANSWLAVRCVKWCWTPG